MVEYYGHPDTIKMFSDKLQKEIEAKITSFGIHTPFGIRLIPDEHFPKGEQRGWKRTDKLKDSKFCTMIDDMDNPPSWAIYFGLVEPNIVAAVYEINESRYTTFNPGDIKLSISEYNNSAFWENIKLLPRRTILSTCSF